MTDRAQGSWYRDPYGRHEVRFWDGQFWSHHVITRGVQGIDPPVGNMPPPTVSTVQPPVQPVPVSQSAARGDKKIQRAIRKAGVIANEHTGGGTLFTEPVLVVSQKAKLIEVNAEYAVFDQGGHKIGAVREVGQSLLKKAIAVSPTGSRSHRFQVVDADGVVQLSLTRPAKFFRSVLVVRDAGGVELGQIVQKIALFGPIRFNLESGGESLGALIAEDWNAWDFSIENAKGAEVGRISRSWSGLTLDTSMKRDRYVVQIHAAVEEPLRSLVVAAALAVDTALRQSGG